jgi:hypothetical protein
MSYQSRQLMQQITKLQRDRDRLIQPEVSPDLISPFLALPMLRGFWAGSVDSAGAWYDLSGLGHTLTYNGNPTHNYAGLVPYWHLDGNDRFSRTDEADLSITGTETYVAANARGITFGCWVRFDNAAAADEYPISKDYDYSIRRINTGEIRASFTSSVPVAYATTSTAVVAANTWTFIAGMVDPGALCYVVVNNEVSTAAAQADIRDGGNDFIVGSDHTPANYVTGDVALVFLCAAFVDTTILSNVFQQTRGAFGV